MSRTSKRLRRQSNSRKVLRVRRRAVAAVKSGRLEICTQRVRGLWMVIGREGYYVQHQRGFRAYDPQRKKTVRMVRATDEQASDLIIQNLPQLQKEAEAPYWKRVTDALRPY